MATTANYIPIVGNFNPDDGFLFQNAAGDNIPSGASVPGRKGKHKFSIIFIIGAGPVGDDATFTLKIPHPDSFTAQQAATAFNPLLPSGSIFYSVAGSQTQEILLNGALAFPTQTFDIAITFGNPLASIFICSFTADFGYSMTD